MSSPLDTEKKNEGPKNEKYTLGLNTIIVTEHVNTYTECPQTVLCVVAYTKKYAAKKIRSMSVASEGYVVCLTWSN